MESENNDYKTLYRKQLKRVRQIFDNYRISFIELRGIEVAPLRFPDLYPFGEASYAQRLRQGEARGVDLGGSQSICYQEEDLFIHPLNKRLSRKDTLLDENMHLPHALARLCEIFILLFSNVQKVLSLCRYADNMRTNNRQLCIKSLIIYTSKTSIF